MNDEMSKTCNSSASASVLIQKTISKTRIVNNFPQKAQRPKSNSRGGAMLQIVSKKGVKKDKEAARW